MMVAKQNVVGHWYFEDDGRTRADLAPMEQELFDARQKIDPFDPSSITAYLRQSSEIKKRWNSPPPAPPDPSEVLEKQAKFERMNRVGSRASSFLTGQSGDSTFVPNPNTLLAGSK